MKKLLYITSTCLGLTGLGISALAKPLIDHIGGNFKGKPSELRTGISPEARTWMDSTLHGLDSSRLVDIHTHMVGSGNKAWVNPQLLSWKHPHKHLQFLTYMSAGGMQSLESATPDYWNRFQELVKHSPLHGGVYLFAFDGSYHRDGRPDSAKSEFIIENTLVDSLARSNPQFKTVISVNPYRKDALDQLDYWGQRGVHMLKWLPNAMGIDPADSNLIPFYQKMRHYNMALITHAGEEKAVDAKEDQALGNPLRLRLPLSQGVRVILAHCASSGTDADLDAPGHPQVPSAQLFARLMNQPEYRDLLYADISAITQVNRYQEILPLIFAHPEWEPRLINGSDYPLPAINVLFNTGSLAKAGYIQKNEALYLREIYAYNPLMFDLLLKLSLRDPKTGRHLNKSVFYRPLFLDS